MNSIDGIEVFRLGRLMFVCFVLCGVLFSVFIGRDGTADYLDMVSYSDEQVSTETYNVLVGDRIPISKTEYSKFEYLGEVDKRGVNHKIVIGERYSDGSIKTMYVDLRKGDVIDLKGIKDNNNSIEFYFDGVVDGDLVIRVKTIVKIEERLLVKKDKSGDVLKKVVEESDVDKKTVVLKFGDKLPIELEFDKFNKSDQVVGYVFEGIEKISEGKFKLDIRKRMMSYDDKKTYEDKLSVNVREGQLVNTFTSEDGDSRFEVLFVSYDNSYVTFVVSEFKLVLDEPGFEDVVDLSSVL